MSMQSIFYKKFIKKILFFQIILSILIGSIAYKICFVEKIFGYQVLYAYQKAKIINLDEIDTIFLGDSSLGNTIDAIYFNKLSGLKSLNLSLTGMYGYAGSYNMLKSVNKKIKIKNVILMNTLGTMTRAIAYDGYIYTMADVNDFIELKFHKKMAILKSFVQIFLSKNNLSRFIEFYILGKKNINIIENDYIKQNSPLKQNFFGSFNVPQKINKDRLFFLEKIKKYCDNNNINLIYVHGPIQKNIAEKSKPYISFINQILYNKKLKLKEKVLHISINEIGDSNDHVRPLYKKQFTERYFHLIKHDLLY